MSFARWAFLRPWCEPVLRRLELQHHVEMTRVPPISFQSIRVSLLLSVHQGRDPGALRAIRDALVLLAILARADFAAYKHVLEVYCGLRLDKSPRCVDDPGFRTARFKLELDKDTWSFFVDMDVPSSKSFTAAVSRIARYRDGCAPSLDALDIPIVVVVTGGEYSYEFSVEPVYRALRERIARRGNRRFPINLRTSNSSDRAFDCAFLIEALEVEMENMVLSHEEAGLAGEMVETAGELPLASLDLELGITSEFHLNSPRYVEIIGRLSTRVLCAAEFPRKAPLTIGEVRLSWPISTPTSRVRMCTALAETKTTDKITVSLNDDHHSDKIRSQIWACAAYAFFSEHARQYSSVRRLRLLKAELDLNDVEAISAVLASADPVRHLFGRKREIDKGDNRAQAKDLATSARAGNRWILPGGTSLTLQWLDDFDEYSADSAIWDLTTDAAGVQIIHQANKEHEEEEVTVLVPGYGVCTVARNALIAVDDEEQPAGDGVIDLDLDYMTVLGDGEAVYQLLALIGFPLTRLRLALHVNEGFELDIGRVLRSCPNLKSLIVAGLTVNADAFLAAYRDGNARIEELMIAFDELDEFTKELSDKTTALARTLKRVVYFFSSIRPGIGELQFQAVPSMLESNNVLEDVQVMAPGRLWETYTEPLFPYHNELLPVAREPFPLQCRLAFLSIFSASQRQRSPDAKRAKSASTPVSSVLASFTADRGVISIIFGFAAECLRRRVYCDKWNGDDEWNEDSESSEEGESSEDNQWGVYGEWSVEDESSEDGESDEDVFF